MKDPLSPQERSKQMSLVRSKDTKPEKIIRKIVYGMGYRYRLHVRDIIGCPDMVFRARRKVIFIHGCFWHQHKCKLGNRIPKSRVKFWHDKLEKNKKRDIEVTRRLKSEGWSVLIIWECQIHQQNLNRLSSRIQQFLNN